eukprot:3006656-Amphidinium_carterae.1
MDTFSVLWGEFSLIPPLLGWVVASGGICRRRENPDTVFPGCARETIAHVKVALSLRLPAPNA